MAKVFIVPGFGIPKNFFEDKTYNQYLSLVLDKIDSFSKEHPKTKIIIIFCGGRTDCEPPFRRRESEEMVKLFLKKAKDFQIDIGKWKIVKEQTSFSTLENLMNANKILLRVEDVSGVIIFSEETRVSRIKKLAKIIFKIPTVVMPIKLYTEEQMKDIELMEEKEKVAFFYSLWALKKKENMRTYRRAMIEKFRMMRNTEENSRDEVLKEWWRKAIMDFRKNSGLKLKLDK